MNVSVALSNLVASRQNPRRVKPEREAHRKLVASIRSHGLLEPLVVRPVEDEKGTYRVIAGNRRLAALREVHRGDGDAKVACVVKKVDDDTAAAMSLAENFAREAMHPLDEAEAFAGLAREECKGVAAIAEEFGVSQTYVRQRMKLAGLADVVKASLRAGSITLGVAEALAAVPVEGGRQEALWEQMGGKPRNAEQVRALIEHAWIPAGHAIFDVKAIEAGSREAVTHDLFGGSVLIERSVFMAAQAEAMKQERARLMEDGWKEVAVGEREQVQERLYAMDDAPPEYDAKTRKRLESIDAKRRALEETPVDSEEAAEELDTALNALDEQEREILVGATVRYGEATKAAGSVFLILTPEGEVRREYRVPRLATRERGGSVNGVHAHMNGTQESGRPGVGGGMPTCDDLSDRQHAEAFTHEAIAVREALLKDRIARKRLLVLALHPGVRCMALALRPGDNYTTDHAETAEGFESPLFRSQQERRKELDPFAGKTIGGVNEVEAYTGLKDLSEKQLDALIGVLIVEVFTGSTTAQALLVRTIRDELSVDVRWKEGWTPSAAWLAGYQKAHLAHLVGVLKGGPEGQVTVTAAALGRKKSELVEELAALFAQAATDPKSLGDRDLAERVNRWRPASLKEVFVMERVER